VPFVSDLFLQYYCCTSAVTYEGNIKSVQFIRTCEIHLKSFSKLSLKSYLVLCIFCGDLVSFTISGSWIRCCFRFVSSRIRHIVIRAYWLREIVKYDGEVACSGNLRKANVPPRLETMPPPPYRKLFFVAALLLWTFHVASFSAVLTTCVATAVMCPCFLGPQ
jgi:hypothetical protein